MLRAVPRNVFSWDFSIQANGAAVAEIDQSWFREQGEFVLDGRRFTLYRESWMGGDFILESETGVIARAVKPNAFLRMFEVEHEGRTFVLRALSLFTRGFGLYEHDRPIGSIRPASMFWREASIELPESIPLAVRIFMFWLVLLLWRRAASQSAGAAT